MPLQLLTFGVLVLIGSFWNIQAETYCSLSVAVIDPQGRPVAEANVSVTESDGRTVEKPAVRGTAEFCDLGMKPVTVAVGHPPCNQTVVKGVGLRWGLTTRVKVIYDREPCLIDEPPVAACQMLFRFADPEQHWLKGVALKVQTPQSETLKTDEYGRVYRGIAAFKEFVAVASLPGYGPAEIRIPCNSENQRLERHITLGRAGPK